MRHSPISLTVFNHPDHGGFRAFERDGSAWFVAKDVAEALGYDQTAKAVRTHCKGVSQMDTPSPGGVQTMKIIPEPDLYRLILRSKLPSAEAFQDWIVEEVLPSIRKTGSYEIEQSEDELLHQALLVSSQRIERLKAEKEALVLENQELEEEVVDARPKVESHDALMNSEGLFDMAKAAKILGMGRNRLFGWLRQEGIFFQHQNIPKQEHLDSGRFVVKASTWEHPDIGEQSYAKALATPKGLDYLRKRLAQSLTQN